MEWIFECTLQACPSIPMGYIGNNGRTMRWIYSTWTKLPLQRYNRVPSNSHSPRRLAPSRNKVCFYLSRCVDCVHRKCVAVRCSKWKEVRQGAVISFFNWLQCQQQSTIPEVFYSFALPVPRTSTNILSPIFAALVLMIAYWKVFQN